MLTVAQLKDAGWGDRAEDFHAFLRMVNRNVERMVGLSLDDLPDQDFASAFEDGESPLDFAKEMLLEEGFDV